MEDNCTASTTIKSVHNFRCVVKSGRLFRSARQDNITEEDCAILEKLNLKTVLDLRSVQEYQKARGDKLLDQDREVHRVIFSNEEGDTKSQWPLETELIHKPKCGDTPRRRYIINYIGFHLIIPMLKRLSILQGFKLFLFLAVDAIFGSKYATQYFSKTLINPAGLASSYKDMLDLSGKQIATSLRLLTQPEVLPALINCAIGKDRTGLLIALVLSVLGHSDDYIADDYALSEAGLKEVKGKVMQNISAGYNWSMDESFAEAKKETMIEILSYLRNKYGSIPNYLESIGFGSRDQEQLKKNLSEV